MTATRRSRVAVSALAGIAGFVIAYLPQLWAYSVLNGYLGPSRIVARKMTWYSPHAFGVLASPEHGLLFWTPLLLLSLAGLLFLIRGSAPDSRRIAGCMVLGFLSQVYVSGSVESWTVAGAFGQRRFVGLTAIFLVGLAACWSRPVTVRARAALMATTAVMIWWNLALMAQFGAGLMDRQRLELSRNAYHTFVTIPARLPDLAYRYVFRRGSFYKGSAAPGP